MKLIKTYLPVLFMVCLLLFNAHAALAEEIKDVEPGNAYIPEDTVLNLVLVDKLDSNVHKKGDRVKFTLKDDLAVENIVIIPQGTELGGVIRKAHGSRIFNQSAVIRVQLDDVLLPNGKPVSFPQDVKIKGGINYANMAVSTAIGFVVPLSGMFFKGREIDLEPGTIIDYKLKDKVVLINGSTGGIGQALARAFAAEGCKLALSSTAQEKLDAFVPTLDIAAENLKTFVADVTKPEEIKAYVDGAVEYFGHIDIVIPNAGYEGEYQLIQDATMESWMKVYSVNVFGVMYLMKYAAPYLIAQGSGAVVTIASNGSYTTAAGMAAYCSSKHAVAGLAKSVALELGPHGIHCNYICPGGVETPMIHRIEKATFGDTKTHEECEQIFGAAYLDKRYCRADEVANLALYLASDVSSHIMGSGIRMDAGMDALC